MKRVRRLFNAAMLGFMLAAASSLLPGQGAVPAIAAGKAVFVDDNGAECPGPNTYPNLAAAVAALGVTNTNVTITWCAGLYPAATNSASFTNFKNLKIAGKGGPMIDATGFDGIFLHISSSSKVSVSGLQIIGGGDLSGSGNATAIAFDNSSGTIKGNLIAGWHQDYTGLLTHVDDGIDIYTTDASQKVKIDRNTLFDIQDNGIAATGPAKISITKNRILQHNEVDVVNTFTPGPAMQAGILLLNAAAGSVVSGNVIEGNTGLEPLCNVCLISHVGRGIALVQTSGAKVSGNTVSFMGYGISVESWCYDLSATLSQTHADGNVISGNKLLDNGAGFHTHATNHYGTSCTAIASHNIVKGNKFNKDGVVGGYAVALSATSPDVISGDIVTGNTITGYMVTPMDQTFFINGTGVSGTVKTPNKINPMPITGAK